jgi:hypothetical protein
MDDNHDGYGDKVITMPRPKTPSLLDQILNPLSTPDNKASTSAAAPVASQPAMPPPTAPETMPPPEPPKKSDPRPSPGEIYRPHSLFLNRLEERQVTLHFIAKDCIPHGVAYARYEDIEFDRDATPGGGLDLVVHFGGTKAVDVRISGRNLGGVYDYISRNTMPWVWARPDGRYADNDATIVITSWAFVDPATGEVLSTS